MTRVAVDDGWLPPSLDQVRAGWVPMCLRLRLVDLHAAAQARVAEPVEVAGTVLTVSVATPVLKTLMDRNVGVVETALAGRYGGTWTVRVRVDPRPPRPPEPMPPVDIIVV